MFDDWKSAWREAVENFERELRADAAGDDPGRGMRRQLAAARTALARLQTEIDRAAAEAASEREAEQVCMRRQTLALDISDDETVRIAGEYAARHAERAALYERKTDVLRDEHALLARDLEIMEKEFAARVPADTDSDDDAVGAGTGGSGRRTRRAPVEPGEAEEMSRQDLELARLRRERAASEKLEELKKKMRGV
jgi:hypothetical protein